MRLFLLAASLLAAAPAYAQTECWQAEWCQPAAPFRIVGNVYYVGTAGLSSFLITGPKGHAHFDHMGGLAELKRLSGAKLVAGAKDAADVEAGRAAFRPEQPAVPPAAVDRRVGEGDVLTLGPIRLVAHATPGHTPGATSWTMTTREGGRPVSVIFASSLTVAGLKLEGNAGYPGAVADYRSSFAKLRAIKADVFLSAHPATFGMIAKRERLAADPLAFVNPAELGRAVDTAERDFEAALVEQRRPKAQ